MVILKVESLPPIVEKVKQNKPESRNQETATATF